ncbi:MAG TPA: transcription elongation factor GreA [Rhodospirillaceae bacterium]|uniref:transcription elongation factor GreA n=1 Tax=Hwanghaeella sp. 1Z406 TaxID=3402811 RepID=UPI000C8B781B|nr:transcription elongation factor GreA [Rhodospirillaceae bacterium]MAO92275.1 transcription elongation factor GreA [Rhodospirillales bacterium]MBB58781.1 transcription elongation factor GreA [Rhodospirillaceae bacterium]HAE00550.1 transcription elongation factor GreA [Rhodospirillaceae bacterium]HAJ22563.1 transcription elongation factor GreA [Rhodospirillaceae bacterium]
MQKVPMTLQGYDAMTSELKFLKGTERPAIIQAIAEAREHGDLSENAEYHAARERQSFVEGRIAELEDQSSRAEVIDPAKLSGDSVKFGATVVIADCETDEESTYQIVGEFEADLTKRMISVTSPMARAMIGKAVGDVFEVNSPGGTRDYEVVSVTFK